MTTTETDMTITQAIGMVSELTDRRVRRYECAGETVELPDGVTETTAGSAAMEMTRARKMAQGMMVLGFAGPKADTTLVVVLVEDRGTWLEATDRARALSKARVAEINAAAGVDEDGEPRPYATKIVFGEDGAKLVRVWDVHAQQWRILEAERVTQQIMATLTDGERAMIRGLRGEGEGDCPDACPNRIAGEPCAMQHGWEL